MGKARLSLRLLIASATIFFKAANVIFLLGRMPIAEEVGLKHNRDYDLD